MSQLSTDNFTRADSNTVGNSWVDTYAHYKIASNTLQPRATTASVVSTTTNGAMVGGVTTAIPVASGGTTYVAGDLIMLEIGTTNVEYVIAAGGSTATSIPLTAACVNTHSSGVTMIRQRYLPLLRPVGENVRDVQMVVDMGALVSTAQSFAFYLRWQDPGNYIRVSCALAASPTQLTFTTFYCVNGQETGVSGGTQNFVVAAGYIPRFVLSVYGTNPTTINVKPFRNISGVYSSLSTSGSVKSYTVPVTTAQAPAVQSTGYQGITVETISGPGYTGFTSYNITQASVAVNDAQAQKGFSPYNWYQNGATYAQTQHTPAYIKLKFTGTQLSFTRDTSQWQVGAVTGPAFKYTLDGANWTYPAATTGTTLTLAQGLVYGTHTCDIYWRTMPSGGTQDLWTGPASSERITGFILDNGESFVDPGVSADNSLWFCDSLGLGPTAGDVDALADPASNFAMGVSLALGTELGNIAFGGQGYGSVGVSNAPQLYDGVTDSNQSWNKFFSGQPRLVGGLFSPPPKYIFCEQSINDFLHTTASATYIANIQGALTAWRAAAPNAKIVIFTAFQGNLGNIWTNMAIAYANYQAATPDANCYFLQLNASVAKAFTSTRFDGASSGTSGADDSIHPILSEEVQLIAYLSQKLFPALFPAIQKVSSNNLSGGF